MTAKAEEETVELEEKMKECGLKLSSVLAEIEADKETQVSRSAIYREQVRTFCVSEISQKLNGCLFGHVKNAVMS